MRRRDTPHPKTYVCARAASAVLLAGDLAVGAWSAAPWTDGFMDIEGPSMPAPYHETRLKMLWDDEFLYIGAYLAEPHVWATLTDHDSVIFHDNDFEVFLDTDGDNHQYYEYEINAFGTDWDLRLVKPYRDGGPALNEWEIPGLRKRVTVHGTVNDPSDRDAGWTVELALPWGVLAEYSNVPSPPEVGDQWRINFSRVQWETDVVDGKYVKVAGRKEHNWVWSPQWAIDMHRPELWGYLQFADRAEETPRPDPTWATRMALMEVYDAQKVHRPAHGVWAGTLAALGLQDLESAVSLALTAEGYCAEALALTPSGPVAVSIRQDSLIAMRELR